MVEWYAHVAPEGLQLAAGGWTVFLTMSNCCIVGILESIYAL